MSRLKGKARVKANKTKRNKQKNDFFLRKKRLIGEIRKYDDPILSVECSEVSVDEWKSCADSIKDTFKKMKQVLNFTENGVGLAASQIGITRKMVIIKPNPKSNDMIYMINPEIISTSDEKKLGREGCLSYPGIMGIVERYTSVEIEYYDENWKKHTIKYEEGNILGIIVQHELDHLSVGHCPIHDWWKDPIGKQKELEEKFESKEEESSDYEIEESEDLKKEKEEAGEN